MLATGAQGATELAGDLRVVAPEENVTPAGTTLVEQRQQTGTTRVPTSADADCFGEGTGGSGAKVKVPGATALGIVKQASLSSRDLLPLAITDAFDFGLGICGFGGFDAPQTGYWYLKVNHVGSSAGGDGTSIAQGDDVLWYLIEDFTAPTPAELEIKAPARVRKGDPIPVRAFEYADDGTRTPAEGVSIVGLGTDTDAAGRATVEAAGEVTELRGVREGAIPSNALEVCSKDRFQECQSGHLTKIAGTNGPDRVRGTKGPVSVSSLAGGDRIDVRAARGSVRPVIDCGAGKDVVIARAGQKLKAEASCETISRR